MSKHDLLLAIDEKPFLIANGEPGDIRTHICRYKDNAKPEDRYCFDNTDDDSVIFFERNVSGAWVLLDAEIWANINVDISLIAPALICTLDEFKKRSAAMDLQFREDPDDSPQAYDTNYVYYWRQLKEDGQPVDSGLVVRRDDDEDLESARLMSFLWGIFV